MIALIINRAYIHAHVSHCCIPKTMAFYVHHFNKHWPREGTINLHNKNDLFNVETILLLYFMVNKKKWCTCTFITKLHLYLHVFLFLCCPWEMANFSDKREQKRFSLNRESTLLIIHGRNMNDMLLLKKKHTWQTQPQFHHLSNLSCIWWHWSKEPETYQICRQNTQAQTELEK